MTESLYITESYDQIYRWVESRYGSSQIALFQPSFESVNQRLGFANYHLQQAENLMADAVQGTSPLEPLLWLTGARSENTAKLQEAMVWGHAHVLAALQNTHASADLLAHAIYYGTGMNLCSTTKLKERDISSLKVISRIQAPLIKAAFETLTNQEDYRYLADLTNRSKHRSIVSMPVQIDLLRATQPELFFDAFQHDSRNHPKRPAFYFLRQEHRRVADAAARTILALIETLKESPATQVKII
ncbi:hypothetical protein [Xanthomonas dyei]|uniref:hypothetical protein n=1 Tax=Xanthomonas dyei TaxID=743699 RepID=UPI0012900CFC|nr:hypothetical protein [Xanthomonas dyei]